MPETRPPYAPEIRWQTVDLVRAGRGAQDLARDLEFSAQAIRSWVADADRRDGRREPKQVVVDVALVDLLGALDDSGERRLAVQAFDAAVDKPRVPLDRCPPAPPRDRSRVGRRLEVEQV